MTTPLVILGAGGHGREILDIVNDMNGQPLGTSLEHFDFIGFVDDGQPNIVRLSRLGVRLIGTTATLIDLPRGCKYTIGIGSGTARRTLDNAATAAGLEPAILVHSSATIGSDVRISPGAVICAQVSVTTNVSIGRHAHINRNSAVGHDSCLSDYSTINPLCAISGEVSIGEETTVGTNSSVNQGLTIGRGAFIASGSAVTKDVDDHTLVAGVPAIKKKELPH